MQQTDISEFEKSGSLEITVGDEKIALALEDVEIQTEDIPGLTVATEGQLTVALDINVTEELKQEGIAREFINKIQNLRKESDFEVTDRINITIEKHPDFDNAVQNHKEYICAQTLANQLELVDNLNDAGAKAIEIEKDVMVQILVEKQ
jgi:isoleucyl-tRNA synthetase